jgi:hypothetical protein
MPSPDRLFASPLNWINFAVVGVIWFGIAGLFYGWVRILAAMMPQ